MHLEAHPRHVLSFPDPFNDPVTHENFLAIKAAPDLNTLATVRPDTRGCCEKVWTLFCMGNVYNRVTNSADQNLWRLMHAPDDALDVFEDLRRQVMDTDHNKFKYSRLEGGRVGFLLEVVGDVPLVFEQAPQGIPSRVTANLWAPTDQERDAANEPARTNLHDFAIYNHGSDGLKALLHKLARPATFMAVCRAFHQDEPDVPDVRDGAEAADGADGAGQVSTEMANPEIGNPGMGNPEMRASRPEAPLLEQPQRPAPIFTLSEEGSDLIRADIHYLVGSVLFDVSFLIRKNPAGVRDEDTLQCIFAKYTSEIPPV